MRIETQLPAHVNISDLYSGTSTTDTHPLRGELRRHESMKRHVSWRAGGNVDYFYQPADLEDLAVFLRNWPKDKPVVMIGLGSNLLVRDGGLPGVVICLHAKLNELILVKQNEQSSLVYADAGIPCAKLAKFTASHNLTGAEFMAGIPGTIGGALAMNAGCYGSETWDLVEHVATIDRNGVIRKRQPEDYRIGYRHVELHETTSPGAPNTWFTGGWFKLRPGKAEDSRQTIRTLLTTRVKTQPLGYPNAGSVFRNPPGDHAARLIEQCGLKGFRIGDAMVSTLHANFIINCDHATATEIEAVIDTVQDAVHLKTGIKLITEVRIIGQSKGSEQ